MPEPTTPTTAGAALAAAEALAHRHHWIFDGTQVGGMLIYHCDDHDDLGRRYGQRFSAAREADLLAMSTPTTPEAALAAALRFNADPPYLYVASDTEGKFDYPAWAAAILAALPPGWCGHDTMLTQQEAEDMGRHAAQQALAAERARIAAAVRGMHSLSAWASIWLRSPFDGNWVDRAAVLAIVEETP